MHIYAEEEAALLQICFDIRLFELLDPSVKSKSKHYQYCRELSAAENHLLTRSALSQMHMADSLENFSFEFYRRSKLAGYHLRMQNLSQLENQGARYLKA